LSSLCAHVRNTLWHYSAANAMKSSSWHSQVDEILQTLVLWYWHLPQHTAYCIRFIIATSNSANQNVAYIHISWSTNKCFIKYVLRCECLVPQDILAMTCRSTLENLEYTAATACYQFWHCFTSRVYNYGVI
jgi:hypothetical protein